MRPRLIHRLFEGAGAGPLIENTIIPINTGWDSQIAYTNVDFMSGEAYATTAVDLVQWKPKAYCTVDATGVMTYGVNIASVSKPAAWYVIYLTEPFNQRKGVVVTMSAVNTAGIKTSGKVWLQNEGVGAYTGYHIRVSTIQYTNSQTGTYTSAPFHMLYYCYPEV